MSDDSQREATHALFLRINAANEALNSETARPQYDQLLGDGIVDYSEHEYKLLLRRQDEQQYGRYRAYAMRAARGDIEWGELAVMAFSLLCALGPLVKWQWSEWKKRERAVEKAKESVRRGKRDVESKMKEQQRLEDEVAKRRAAAVRQEESEDDEDDDGADSEERRREKEARRARLKKARTAMKAALSPYTAQADMSEESKAAAEKVSSEDVDLLVRSLSVEALEQLWTEVEAVRTDEKRKPAVKSAAISELFGVQFAPLAALRLQEQQQLAQQAAAATSSSLLASTANSKAATASGKSREWGSIELSYLAKGMAKWPGGASQRWEKITAYINNSMEAHTDGDSTQQPSSALPQRRTVKDVLARVKLEELRAARGKPELVDGPKAAPTPAPQVPRPADGGGSGVEPVDKKASKDEWTDDEQSAFESALRTVPRDVDDRWERIAAVVSSKSKAQCIRRFKEIRAQIMANKADSSGG